VLDDIFFCLGGNFVFKDYDKYLSVSLKVYLILLVFTFILKIVGLDYFGIDVNDRVVLIIDNFISKYGVIYDSFDCRNRTTEFCWKVK